MLVDRIASLMTVGGVRPAPGLAGMRRPFHDYYPARHLSALCEAVRAAGDVLVARARSR